MFFIRLFIRLYTLPLPLYLSPQYSKMLTILFGVYEENFWVSVENAGVSGKVAVGVSGGTGSPVALRWWCFLPILTFYPFCKADFDFFQELIEAGHPFKKEETSYRTHKSVSSIFYRKISLSKFLFNYDWLITSRIDF